MPRLRVMVLLVVVVASALAALPPVAGAAPPWTRISGYDRSIIDVPSLAATGSQVVVAAQRDMGNTADVDAFTFTPSVSGVTGLSSAHVVQAWGSVSPALLARPGAPLQIVLIGLHSSTTGDNLNGTALATRNPDGSWGAPVPTGNTQYDGYPSGLLLPDGTPLWAENQAGGINVLRGAANPTMTDLQAALAGCCGYAPAIGMDAMGRLWVAWYSNATGHTALYMQQVDPATGTALGTPLAVPGSAANDNNSLVVALACQAVCRVFYHESDPATPILSSGRLLSWTPGEAAGTLVAKAVQGGGNSAGPYLAAAYTPAGHLWTAWYDRAVGPHGSFVADYGDTRGAGGTPTAIGQPGATFSNFAMNGLASGENLVLAADVNEGDIAKSAIWANVIAPPQVAVPAPGPRDVDLQPAAGGKGFRIQVQYTVPKSCAAPCSGRAEIRTRTGRRLYAKTPPLKGDGPIVFGTRRGIPLSKGIGRKIRFYITVSKHALLEGTFKTVGGYRVAETRLRVWIHEGGSEVLTVRDGRIRVSIARIKSGALPGLTGIL